MDPIAHAYDKLVTRFVQWAERQEAIRAAVIIGSRARTNRPADEWSDLDVVVIAIEPDRYTKVGDWVQIIGAPRLSFVERTGDGRFLERRVLFDGGLDADFAFLPLELFRCEDLLTIPPDMADIFGRGALVLLDKDGMFSAFQLPLPQSPPPPTKAQYLNVVNDFWYHTVWVAKHLRRGEAWWAKTGCDDHLKSLLRQMLEWHAQATQGGGQDTWFRGRFLEEWADPRALAQLPQSFAHYVRVDIWHALLVTRDLFRWVAVETGERLGYAYPHAGDRYASELVDKLYREDKP